MKSGQQMSEDQLEQRLHGLTLSNNLSQNDSVWASQKHQIPSGGIACVSQPQRDALALATEGATQVPTYYEPSPEVQSNGLGRRRPNQAQRRQMTSQSALTIGSQSNLGDQNQLPRGPFHAHSASHTSFTLRGPNDAYPPGNYQVRPLKESTWGSSVNSTAPVQIGFHYDSPQQSGWSRRDPALHPMRHRGLVHHQRHHRKLFTVEDAARQAALLDQLCYQVVLQSEVGRDEIAKKEAFRQKVERICQQAITRHENGSDHTSEFRTSSVELKCFGSLASGFATKSSDLDLALFSPLSSVQPDAPGSPIPRLLEKAFLDEGFGARLLSRARVPIIKLCERPGNGLRMALLAERSKWENGTSIEATEGLEEQEQDPEAQTKPSDSSEAAEPVVGLSDVAPFEIPMRGDSGRIQRFQLRQGSKKSISAYYGVVRRVLRKAGGRDVTSANYRDFTPLDWITLNRFCQAFMRGLHDIELRQRLESYQSLSFEQFRSAPWNRSLAGVFIQIEGEATILEWERSGITSVCQNVTKPLQQAFEDWRELQQTPKFGVDPLAFNRDLQVALDKIQNHPAIQLMRLTQACQELPTQYHLRAKNILFGLGKSEADLSAGDLSGVVSRYIHGIQDDEVRNTLVSTVTTTLRHHLGFHAVGQLHRCLQLAVDLEKALKNDMYDQKLSEDINEYVQLLRSPLERVNNEHFEDEFVLPVAQKSFQLLSKIRTLPDPRRLPAGRSRDRHKDFLEFPTAGIGVQCDINFSAHLALQNTLLLRCYSHTDPRVRPMVLFVKDWAKSRGINSGYRGTLSSYGFVLMVLHYLVHIASPFVCPNLQQLAPRPFAGQNSFDTRDNTIYRKYDVQFWSDEHEIMRLAAGKQLTLNMESIGQLLRGFFEYFAHSGPLSRGFGKGFDWTQDVLSLRTHEGLLSKQAKGWTGAKTVIEGLGSTSSPHSAIHLRSDHSREVRHRYLFAIEDPFEIDHNVARTVTHNGIVSIRDEFRRAWNLIQSSSSEGWSGGELMAHVAQPSDDPESFTKLLEEIHGPRELWNAN